MRAATRNNVTNRLFFTTFLVAFSSVALSTVLPCPAHSLDSESPAHGNHEELKREFSNSNIIEETKKKASTK